MELGKEKINLLLAMAMGDGHLSNDNGNTRLRMEHAEQQLDYLEWKIGLVKGVFLDVHKRVKEYTYKGETRDLISYYVTTKRLKQLNLVRKYLYYNGSKVITPKILDRVGKLGLMIWYMDDGYLGDRKSKGYTLRIYTFMTKDENQELIDYLKSKYNVSFYQVKRSKKTNGYILECGTKQARAFLSIFEDLDKPESMQYKFQIS